MVSKSFKLAALVCAGLIGTQGPAFASKKVNGGGTNYIVYSLGSIDRSAPDQPGSPGNTLDPPLRWRSVVGTLHVTLVNSSPNPYTLADQEHGVFAVFGNPANGYIGQMERMRQAGQTDLALLIYMTTTSLHGCSLERSATYSAVADVNNPAAGTTTNNNANTDGNCGHMQDNSGGKLNTQHQNNLKAIVEKAADLGYRRLFLRFHGESYNKPTTWTSWKEAEYLANRDTIFHTYDLAKTQNANRMELVVDLNADQLAGIDLNQSKPYMKRLWTDFITRYGEAGRAQTVGFSFAYTGPAGPSPANMITW